MQPQRGRVLFRLASKALACRSKMNYKSKELFKNKGKDILLQLKANENKNIYEKYNNSRHIHLLSCTAVMTSCQELYEIANIHRYTSKATDVIHFGFFLYNHKPESLLSPMPNNCYVSYLLYVSCLMLVAEAVAVICRAISNDNSNSSTSSSSNSSNSGSSSSSSSSTSSSTTSSSSSNSSNSSNRSSSSSSSNCCSCLVANCYSYNSVV
uniref:Uncharacterized protein n=1 Tax=Glossina palpalis gambiensis TaxID=67801 RepID=A0A1B0B879_9MUSC